MLDFAQFGSDLDASTRATIDHGRHLVELLKQPQYSPMATADQVVLFFANRHGLTDEIDLKDIREYEESLLHEMNTVHPDVMRQIEEKKEINDELGEHLLEILKVFTTRFNILD